MTFLRGRRRYKWPTTNVYSPRGRGDIKELSAADLRRLTNTAEESGWSAVGRPVWLQEHLEEIHSIWLVVFGAEGPSTYRCIVAVSLNDGSRSSFTLDVSAATFNALTDVSRETLTTLAHRYLEEFPPLDLDADQDEAWRMLE